MRHSQVGIALLLIVFLILGLGTTITLFRLNHSSASLEQDLRVQEALAEAREALIAFAATRSGLPGRLPCPEETSLIGTPAEGNEQVSCSNTVTLVGRLPWRTLGLNNPLTGPGEPLWYVRSPGFQSRPINSNTVGQLQLDGTANTAAALVISPGPPISVQSRTVPSNSAPPNRADYLDLGNSTGPNYQSIGPATLFNDRVLALTKDQIFRAVEARVLTQAKVELQQYFAINHYFPNPANFGDTTCLGSGSNSATCVNDSSTCSSMVCRGRLPANPRITAAPWSNSSLLRGTISAPSDDWFQANGWRELIYYAISKTCSEGTLNCALGNLQVQSPPAPAVMNLKMLLISAGPTLAGQSRSNSLQATNLSNYLEDKNLYPMDQLFVRHPITSATPFNDAIIWLP